METFKSTVVEGMEDTKILEEKGVRTVVETNLYTRWSIY
jgi:pyruvate-formate lyase-activating enzyme